MIDTGTGLTAGQQHVPKWILIVTGIFAVLEIAVSIALCCSPESMLETVDLNAKGADYLVYMWASRQFALGFILAFATWKRSVPMLTIAWVFLLVMFAGDCLIGIVRKETPLIVSALVMCAIISALIMAVNKKR